MSNLCVRHLSKMCVSSFKFELTIEKGVENLPSLINRKLDLTDQESHKSDSAEF